MTKPHAGSHELARALVGCALSFAAAICSIAACHDSQSAPPLPTRAAAPRAAFFGPHRSPVNVELLGPSQVSAGQDIELTATIEQLVGSGMAVELRLNLPDGARLVSGPETERLPAGSGELVRRFVVHLDRVPAADIEIVASANGRSFGGRARSAYRFGRPEPRFAEPPRSEKQLRLSGKNLGRPIQLQRARPR